MTRVGDPEIAAVLSTRKPGVKADPAKREKGVAFCKANPKMTLQQLIAAGPEIGIKQGRNWWMERRFEARGGGGGCAITNE